MGFGSMTKIILYKEKILLELISHKYMYIIYNKDSCKSHDNKEEKAINLAKALALIRSTT